MKADHIVEALTGDSGWRNMIPQVDSSDFPTQWVPSAYECSIIEAKAKEIEKLRGQVPRWIPVEERLPEYNARVLVIDVYAGDGDEFIAIWTREKYPDDPDGCCWIDERGWWHALDEVTHWIPLPEPPEVEKALEAMKDG